jgi:2-polyprenyl-6-methoxyphenol hydroxylase-like FAD-dependent oxidoreductase
VVGNITICSDASQPQSLNLGQGGCMALEDAIILVKSFNKTLKSKES